MSKVPFMLVLGEKKVADGTISVRRQSAGDLGTMTLEAFSNIIEKEIS